MKNKNIILGLITFCLLTINCYSKNITNTLENYNEKLRLLSFRTGNFTNSGKTEILAYYTYKELSKTFVYEYNAAFKLIVFIIDENKIITEYVCEYHNGATYDSDKDKAVLTNMEIINNKKLHFGKWDGYTYVSDYNGNGLDEILLFSNSPETFLPYIFEFQDGKMKTVLNVENKEDFNANIKGFIETTSDKKGKYIEIYDAFDSSRKENVWWEKYTWDAEKKMYVLIDSKYKKYIP